MRSWIKSFGWLVGLPLGALSLGGLWGCGAGGDGGDTTIRSIRDPGDNTAPVLTPGSAGSGATGAPSGGDGTGFTGFEVGDAPPSKGCQQATREFTPKIPTVFILVDRSGSMFDNNVWAPLRTGVLQVISNLEAEVRFGFGAFSGTPGTCPEMPTAGPNIENHTAIASLYNSLDRPSYKSETPTLAALTRASQTLWSDPAVGDKYILFVTDGEPDYCDDSNALCPPDSVVGRLQKLALGLDDTGAQQVPIHTLVFGIESASPPISPAVLQAFANAGAGQAVAPPNTDPNALFYQCPQVPGWMADFQTTGKVLAAGESIGTYAPVGTAAGTATVYRPDTSNQAALIQEISGALAGVKSCSFDLGNDGVQVDLGRTDLGDLAKILVNGNPVPFDTVNGWHMLSPTTVQLEGAACSNWRAPGESSIDFDVPCDVIILR
jgi:hypothetical protein